MALAKHLTDCDIERIVEIIDGWSDKLTWEALCGACLPIIGTYNPSLIRSRAMWRLKQTGVKGVLIHRGNFQKIGFDVLRISAATTFLA